MAKTYRVWVAVELHDEKTDEYHDLTQFGSTAEFTGRGAEDKATSLASSMNDIGLELANLMEAGKRKGESV